MSITHHNPAQSSLEFPPIFKRIQTIVQQTHDFQNTPIYLVGGAVRDAFLQRATHDLDFVLPEDALRTGRKIANTLGGAFYILDEQRKTGRVVLAEGEADSTNLDFAQFRGNDLESDLRDRDFTINAMAVRIDQPNQLIDPLNGIVDLHQKQLRTCHPDAFQNDPLRILRGIRLAVELQLHMLPQTRQTMRKGIPLLSKVSPERKRDELFRILAGRKPITALRIMDLMGILPELLPKLTALHGITQSPPHTHDVWEHMLLTQENLLGIIDLLSGVPNPENGGNLFWGMISQQLGRYRENIVQHLKTALNPNRSLRSLLAFAALYHDVGKSETRSVGNDGRIHFFEHERFGAKMASRRAKSLCLSVQETQRIATIIQHHMRPKWLAQTSTPPSRRAIFRFFKDTGAAGIDVCLLSLADTLAASGMETPPQDYAALLNVIRALFDAYWNTPQQSISPQVFLNGNDLMQTLSISPGPLIGKILASLQEAQACQQVTTPEEALKFTRQWLVEYRKNNS